MKLKVLLTAFLLLSAFFVVVAANQLQSEKGPAPSETNGIINQPSNETNTASVNSPNGTDTEPLLNETNAASDAIEVEATLYPFKLTMMLNKTEFKLGEPVNITLRLKNIGNETVALSSMHTDYFLYFLVYNDANSVVWDEYNHSVWFQIPITYWIEPDEEYVRTTSWAQDGSSVRYPPYPPESYYKVPAGTYHIAGILVYQPYFETPSITITILKE